MGSFLDKLNGAADRNDSLLCLGLDPDPTSLPSGMRYSPEGVVEFNRMVIEATSDLVCAYKPNLAFYEALGSRGLAALEKTLADIPAHIPTIADAKRGDVDNTARMYAAAVFDTWGFDSVTVNPYMGMDALQPFLERSGKGVWIVCRTSNPGGAEFQGRLVRDGDAHVPLFELVAARAAGAERAADVGLVVGATASDELGSIRRLAPSLPLLIPGVGAQGGDARAAVEAARTGPVVINASRSVLYGTSGADAADGVRARAAALRDQLNELRGAAQPA